MTEVVKQRGAMARVFGGLWWLINGARRLVLNLLFLAIAVALLAAWLASGGPKLKEKTTLVLNLGGPISEQEAGSARDAALNQLQGEEVARTRLRDVLAVLEAAAKDDKINGVLLALDNVSGGGLAAQREVAAAITRFRASGKKVTAWGLNYDQRQFYIAAHADEVFLHPMGALLLEGYGRQRNYYRDAFDRLGVSANVIRVGKFKSAGEPYFANAPSPATLEAEGLLFNDLWALYVDGVETARKLPPGTLMKGIDALPGSLVAAGGDIAKLALESKLIDATQTQDELRKLLTERGAVDDEKKTFRQIDFHGYLATLKPAKQGDGVAVIVAEGEISDGIAPQGRIGGRSTGELVRKAREDDKIKAVVLRVNSPGGSAVGSELVRRELELTRAAGKPVVVSMGDVAASGGYWISMAADEIIADPATITGSIGVFAMLPTAEGLMDKLSVRTGGVATTWLGTAYDPRKALQPRFTELVQSSINHIYAEFTGKAAVARKTTPDKIDEVAQGRVWTGAQAKARGLIDRTGSFGDALAAARTRAKLAADARATYIEREGGRLQQLIGMFGGALSKVMHDVMGEPLLGLPAPASALRDAQRDLQWVSAVAERRQPFAAIVHCLCGPAQ
jgi:protease-4